MYICDDIAKLIFIYSNFVLFVQDWFDRREFVQFEVRACITLYGGVHVHVPTVNCSMLPATCTWYST